MTRGGLATVTYTVSVRIDDIMLMKDTGMTYEDAQVSRRYWQRLPNAAVTVTAEI